MKRYAFIPALVFAALLLITACGPRPDYDVVIRHGTIYDGSGGTPYVTDVAIRADTIAAIGDLDTLQGRIEINASGMAVTPGFINMLSWANESLIHDGRGGPVNSSC